MRLFRYRVYMVLVSNYAYCNDAERVLPSVGESYLLEMQQLCAKYPKKTRRGANNTPPLVKPVTYMEQHVDELHANNVGFGNPVRYTRNNRSNRSLVPLPMSPCLTSPDHPRSLICQPTLTSRRMIRGETINRIGRRDWIYPCRQHVSSHPTGGATRQ